MEKRTPWLTWILSCTVVGAVWSSLACLAFIESWSHGWDPYYQPTLWSNIQAFFGLSAVLFVPGAYLSNPVCGEDLIGFAIGGAIEGGLFGGLLALIASASRPYSAAACNIRARSTL